jgi:ribonuclease P protein subunit RPR2
MDTGQVIAQATTFAEEFGQLYADERAQRQRAERAISRLEDSLAATVHALAEALELRDDVTGGHAERVTGLALALARDVAPELARDPHLEYAFLLHDVGKIGISDSVLLKRGPLDAGETLLMQSHPALGERIIARIPHLGPVVRDVVVCHHERWDGSGYPLGLQGLSIPLAARIFSLADAFDAMTNERPYRRPLDFDVALAEIRAGAGTQFDPDFLERFVAVCRDSRAATCTDTDTASDAGTGAGATVTDFASARRQRRNPAAELGLGA